MEAEVNGEIIQAVNEADLIQKLKALGFNDIVLVDQTVVEAKPVVKSTVVKIKSR